MATIDITEEKDMEAKMTMDKLIGDIKVQGKAGLHTQSDNVDGVAIGSSGKPQQLDKVLQLLSSNHLPVTEVEGTKYVLNRGGTFSNIYLAESGTA